MESWIQKFKQQVPMPETCPFCGRRLTPENARVDHIIPAKLGGKNEIDNLRYLCNRCNILKADSAFLYPEKGITVLESFSYGNSCYIFSSIFSKVVWIYLPALVICGYSIFRTTSRNLIRRQSENVWFLQKTDIVKKFFDLQKRRWRDRKKSRYYRCKGCRQMIRVPKGHGKIEITCPKCGNKFIRKT